MVNYIKSANWRSFLAFTSQECCTVKKKKKMIECIIGVSCKGRKVDAWVPRTEEGRGQLRKATGSCKQA